MLYYLRTVLEADLFEEIRSTRLFQNHPPLLQDLMISLVPAEKTFGRMRQIPLSEEENGVKRAKDVYNFLKEYYDQLLIQKLKKDKITVFGDDTFLKKVYKTYLDELIGQPILIWGTGEFFRKIKEIFQEVTIEAFIDNNPNKQEESFDSGLIKAPFYLKNCDLPVFICSSFKEDIYQQIKKDYPHISIIP